MGILLALAVLFIAWILGWVVFHVSAAAIHILLVVAFVMLILHLVRGPARV